jgi:hypothetical protein
MVETVMQVKLYRGITELCGTKAEGFQFLINAGLKETLTGWEGRGMVGELVNAESAWVARFWEPTEREGWEKLHGQE